MTASPYASDAKIAEACAAIGADLIGQTEQTLLQQLVVAAAVGGGGGGGGTMATQNSDAVAITGGTITGLTDFGVAMANNIAMTGFALGTISDTTSRPFTIAGGATNAAFAGTFVQVKASINGPIASSVKILSIFGGTSGTTEFWSFGGDGSLSGGGLYPINNVYSVSTLAHTSVGDSATLADDSWATPGLSVRSTGWIGFASGAATSFVNDAFFMRGGAAHIKMGATHATTATNQTLSAHNVTTGTGADLILAGGTGSVANGNVRFGTHAAVGVELVTGYITIKDEGGTLRKLAVIS
jgi:hypothetical protein